MEVCKKYGRDYTKELQMEMFGLTTREICSKVAIKLNLPIADVILQAQLEEKVQDLLPKAPLQPGVERLLKHLHKSGIPIALATNSRASVVKLHEESRPKIFSLFHHKVTINDPDISCGKPKPDIFLIAALRFPHKPKPKNCLVFEDSPVGVIAAKAAGMQVVLIQKCYREMKRKKPDATLIINSLLEFQPEIFGLPPFADNNDSKPTSK